MSDLASPQWWDAAVQDLAAASQQHGAPVRWAAARNFAEGEARLVRGDPDSAIASFRSAIAVDPEWAVPYVGLSRALSTGQRIDEALAAARDGQQREPGWWRPVAAAGHALSVANRLEEAIQEFRRALGLAPNEPNLMAALALTYHASHIDIEAERYARMALEIDPEMVAAHLLLAERALEQNDGHLALSEASRAVGVAPRSAAAQLALADAQVLTGQKQEAAITYQRALDAWEAAPAAGVPQERLRLTRASLARHELPPPRISSSRLPARSRSERTRDEDETIPVEF
jgi:tetratricopeptide (TPR) repeat protein